jgi:hypothetical protein
MKLPGATYMLLYAAVLAAAGLGVRETLTVTIAPSLAAKTMPGCLPSRDGYLRARLRGDGDIDIDWRNADMRCDGGPRPDDSGVRVTFVGRVPPQGRHLRLVFGITAPPATTTARNVPTNVTVIFEDQQKLFSTAGDRRCMIDELTIHPVETPATRPWHRVEARGFCTAPASTLTGSESLLLDRFDFAGTVRDEDDE